MTDSVLRVARADRIAYGIRAETDAPRLGWLLRDHRLYAAYALAQLEPAGFGLSSWWTCETPDGLALVSHSRGGLGDTTFTLGPADGVSAILGIHPGPMRTFATTRPAHVDVLRRTHTLATARTMCRLHVTREAFAPVATGPHVVPLRGIHVRTLNRLYSTEGASTAYQAHHIDAGCYFGVVSGERLVAVAGTHAISPRYGVAVVGNVFTHPGHRGRGYATLATSAVTAALLEPCPDVVLSVDPSNLPALRAYRQLGYVDAGEIVEAAARRRAGGVGSGLRRARARWRGRHEGLEMVRGSRS